MKTSYIFQTESQYFVFCNFIPDSTVIYKNFHSSALRLQYVASLLAAGVCTGAGGRTCLVWWSSEAWVFICQELKCQATSRVPATSVHAFPCVCRR